MSCQLRTMFNANNQISCSNNHFQTEQFKRSNTNTGLKDNNKDLSGRPVLHAGVLWVGMLRKFLISRDVSDTRRSLGWESDVSTDKDVAHATPNNMSSGVYTQQPSIHALNNDRPQEFKEKEIEQLMGREKQESKHSSLANLVHQVQEASVILKGNFQQISGDIYEMVQDTKATTSEKLRTLREEEAVAERYGVITTTSLIGYLSGLRRGVAVRLVYAATGAVATAILCYPEEARQYNDRALALIREGVQLSIHLIKCGQ